MQSAKTKDAQEEQAGQAETVLVVDDNREIVYSICELLKYEGYRTVPAYDGMEALGRHGAGEDRPDPAGCDDAEDERIVSADEAA